MEDRTPLKEKRNNYLWLIWAILTIGISLSLEFMFKFKTGKPLEATLVWAFGLQFVFLIYRIITFGFNQFLLLFFRRKIKINRLEGRVTPIYKLSDYGHYFSISKYSAKYTELDLEWSIPFSVLFEEQEYVLEGSYIFTLDDGGWKAEDITDLEIPYKIKEDEERAEQEREISAKTTKQQKIDNLNKVFNENYK